MRVLVCGGRDFLDRGFVYEELDKLEAHLGPWHLIITGGAEGADRLARDWASDMLISTQTYFPDWEKYDRAAGPIRNQQMLDEGKPDLVVAFPGNKGTKHMVTIAKEAGVKVIEINY